MTNGNVFDYLSKERQAEVTKEAMANALAKMPGKTLGAMVSWLTKHPQWKALADLPASSLVTPSKVVTLPTRSAPTRRIDAMKYRDEVFTLVKKYPGLRSEELQEKCNIPRPAWKLALGWLREQGKVKTKGNKRSAVYTVAGAKPAKKAKKGGK